MLIMRGQHILLAQYISMVIRVEPGYMEGCGRMNLYTAIVQVRVCCRDQGDFSSAPDGTE